MRQRGKFITLRHIYGKYPYKTTTRPLDRRFPFFPDSEITDTPDSLEYLEWKRLITAYTDCLEEYLVSGKKYTLPKRMGFLRMLRTQIKRLAKHPDDQVLFVKWDRDESKFRYKYHWRFKLSRSVMKRARQKSLKDTSIYARITRV